MWRPPAASNSISSLLANKAAPVVGPVIVAAVGFIGIITHVMVSDPSIE